MKVRDGESIDWTQYGIQEVDVHIELPDTTEEFPVLMENSLRLVRKRGRNLPGGTAVEDLGFEARTRSPIDGVRKNSPIRELSPGVEDRVDQSHNFSGIVRLGRVVACAQRRRLHLPLIRGVGGKDHDGAAQPRFLHFAEQAKAVSVREMEVEDRRVDLGGEAAPGFVPVPRFQDVESGVLQSFRYGPPEELVIFDNQDRRHCLTSGIHRQ